MIIQCVGDGPVDILGRPQIIKHGTIDIDLVETNPVVFRDRLYRFECVRERYWANETGRTFSRFVDCETGKATPAFAWDLLFTCAFIDDDIVYVTGTIHEDCMQRGKIVMFVSTDLHSWESRTAIDLPGFGIFNTSICKADDRYVLMFEIDRPFEQCGVPFTARFAASTDMKHWEVISPECNYEKDRYTAPHCLRFLEGYYYNFYLEWVEAHQEYEQYLVRSRDLIHWEQSPLNPVLRLSAEDKLIVDDRFTGEHRNHIIDAWNRNNSDIDFCEFNGRLVISYSWGDQERYEFLASAEYPGTLAQFLKGWFPNSS
ncbi:MAG: hypothetical protein ACYC0V_11335 [Armatimonadota bacterium]